jgi:type VI protein secretion system component VasK
MADFNDLGGKNNPTSRVGASLFGQPKLQLTPEAKKDLKDQLKALQAAIKAGNYPTANSQIAALGNKLHQALEQGYQVEPDLIADYVDTAEAFLTQAASNTPADKMAKHVNTVFNIAAVANPALPTTQLHHALSARLMNMHRLIDPSANQALVDNLGQESKKGQADYKPALHAPAKFIVPHLDNAVFAGKLQAHIQPNTAANETAYKAK